MNIALAYPAFPPALDGIADYSAYLAAELSKRTQVSVLTGVDQEPTQIPGVSIDKGFGAPIIRCSTATIGLRCSPEHLLGTI